MGSNLGPTNKALIERVKGDVDKRKAENPSAQVPIDLVTTPAAGSTRTSRREAASSRCRVLRRRASMAEDRVRQLVGQHSRGPYARLPRRAAR